MGNEEEIYDVVISGISGKFPQCDNLEELKQKLLEKENLISENNGRWNMGVIDVPLATGMIDIVEKFDDTFFGIFSGIASMMDPLTRVAIERAYEALMDAGINPKTLRGNNVAVYTNSCISDSEAIGCDEKLTERFWLLAHIRALLANRISYVLNLQGPSWTIDANWVGGIQCLKQAVTDIRVGRVDSALVGVSNVLIYPDLSQHWLRMGKLSPDGTCQPFQEDSNGYGRSEGVVFLYLQRANEAKRIYASVSHVDAQFCGEKANTLLHPQKEGFEEFFRQFYDDCRIAPNDVAYLEADGSADKYLDEVELNSIGGVLCNQRKDSLLLGTVKSNLGHSEGAASLVSVAKSLICLDSGIIPPNVDFKNPNKNIKNLLSNDVKVVTEPVAFPKGKFAAVNSLGLCSSVGHVLLKSNPKEKNLTSDRHEQIPRLVLLSARHEAGILNNINKLESMTYDEEYFSLINDVFKENISGHFYRGFTILGATEKKIHFTLESGAVNKRPVWFVFAGMGSQWPGMGADLMRLPVFAEAMNELDGYLKPLGVDIINVITSFDPTVLKNVVNSFVGIAAIQIGMVDVLTAAGVEPDGLFGHSLGENGCAYADRCFTKYQAIMAAYFRGKASSEITVNKGLMAAVGLGYDKLQNLPENVEIACHNSADNTTISGLYEEVELFVEELKRKNIFTRSVNSNFIAYHSKQVRPLAPFVLENVSKAVPNPKKRSSRWISTSVPEKDWDNPKALYSSAQYHVDNFLGPVYFQEACAHVPENAIIIEISPHGLFQGILKRSTPESCVCIPLGKREISSPLNFLLSSIGKLFVMGLQPDVNAIYPPVEYPVSKGTPSLASLATWNHEKQWELNNFKDETKIKPMEISLRDRNWRFLTGYKINEKIVVPFSIFLIETLQAYETHDSVLIFENVNIKNFVEIIPNSHVKVYTQVQYGSGNFEIIKEDRVIMNGVLRYSQENLSPNEISSENDLKDYVSFSQNEIQDIFRQHAMDFAQEMNKINEIVFTHEGCQATLIWDNNLAFFLNALVHVKLFYDLCTTEKSPILPISFLKLALEVEKYNTMESGSMVTLTYNKSTNIIKGPGIELMGLKNEYKSALLKNNSLILQDLQFVSHERPTTKNWENFYNVCGQIVGETYFTEIDQEKHEKSLPVSIILTDDLDKEQLQINYLLEVLYRELPHTPIDTIISNSKDFQNGEKNGNKSNRYFILCKNTKNFIDNLSKLVDCVDDVFLLCFDNLSMVPQQFTKITEGNFDLFAATLWKKKIPVNENILKINPFSDSNWLEDFEEELYGVKIQKSVIVHWESEYIIDVVDVINQITAIGSGHSMRYLVIMDKNVPPYQAESEFYKKQLEQGLIMNIFQNGEWGSVRHLSIINDLALHSDFQNLYSKTQKIQNINVNYISIYKSSQRTENQFIADRFEFSGTTSNGRVMGIADLKENDSSSPEPLLTWAVPEEWSLEDAVTVPLTYVKVYFALIIKGKLCSGASILIHSGHTTTGEAAIAIALSLDCDVYTTADTSEQVQYIFKRFPNTNHLHILCTKTTHIDIEVLKLTKNRGVDVIINASTETQVKQSFFCIKKYGAILQLFDNTLDCNSEIGMEIFLKSVALYGLTDLSTLKNQPELRNELQNLVQEGLKSGVISKPFRRMVHKANDESQINLALVENNNTYSVVIQQEADASSRDDAFVCDPEKCYLIVGIKTEIWFNIVAWLIKQGARKLVFIEENLSEKDFNQYQKRFNIFLQNYPDLSLMHLPSDSIYSKEDSGNVINVINSVGPLDAVFCLSLDFQQIDNINDGLLKYGSSLRQLICLQCDASKVCESRHHLSLPALNIIWDRSITDSSMLIGNIKEIINNSLKINSPLIYIADSSHYSSKFENSKISYIEEFLPTFLESEFFTESFSLIPTFEKVISKCALYDTRTQLFPIFVIPGIHSQRLLPLFKNLMYPVYSAKISPKNSSARNTAQSLIKPLKNIQPHGPYTIIGDSWSGAVAMELTSLLEQNYENRVQLILLEGIPKDMKDKLSLLGTFGSREFLDNICNICFGRKIIKDVQLEDGKVKVDNEQIKFLELLQRKLTLIQHYSPTNVNINGKVIALKTSDADVLSTQIYFEEYYGQDLDLKVSGGNYNDLINSNITANIINDNVLFKW